MAKTKARFTITINEQLCKACGLCVEICPQHSLGLASHINKRGFHPATVCLEDKCTGCAQCALMCPDMCIKIMRAESETPAGS